ncbi:hypothetical protein PHLGIDRAFT_20475 [Phlebiopsis gigantea 11061_1 CR5-6]|uniref:Uncharacterized protein n=1 Tax=Phlebiopsis gigantea (strain 11061_1 CR5-6) TaxID=745531 RepID=A0A0C3S0C1_PHLG1|nr:hypothetical protein PHLGIDRAFT_20475 [Phlebiopsis gigantea 11061_1 CR5-6]
MRATFKPIVIVPLVDFGSLGSEVMGFSVYLTELQRRRVCPSAESQEPTKRRRRKRAILRPALYAVRLSASHCSSPRGLDWVNISPCCVHSNILEEIFPSSLLRDGSKVTQLVS